MGATDGILDGTHYRVSGAGAPVILIHGVGADLEMWEPVAARLARARPERSDPYRLQDQGASFDKLRMRGNLTGKKEDPHPELVEGRTAPIPASRSCCHGSHRVIRYDMLGHGASAKPPGPYDLADFVRQLERLADGLGVARFALAGFSMGGLVAQGFALAQGGRVDRLVLLNTVFDRNPEERAAIAARVREIADGGYMASIAPALERWFTPAFRARQPEVVAAVRRRMEGNHVQAYAAAYAVFATADRDLAPAIGRIAVPTTVVTGAEDQRSTPPMARAMVARLPRARLQIVAGQRHMTPLEVPDLVAAIITEAAVSAETTAAQ